MSNETLQEVEALREQEIDIITVLQMAGITTQPALAGVKELAKKVGKERRHLLKLNEDRATLQVRLDHQEFLSAMLMDELAVCKHSAKAVMTVLASEPTLESMYRVVDLLRQIAEWEPA